MSTKLKLLHPTDRDSDHDSDTNHHGRKAPSVQLIQPVNIVSPKSPSMQEASSSHNYKNRPSSSSAAGGSGGVVKYMECLKNHAAAIGGRARDGCGEFMAGGEEGTLEALMCAACGCHRNFHDKKIVIRPELAAHSAGEEGEPGKKKRFRTKFSQEQKEKMFKFAENAEWKIQKVDESEVGQFCQEIGINSKVLRIWMHNNKSNFTKKINNSAAPPPN